VKSDLRVNEPLVPYFVNCGRYYIGGTWNPPTLLVKWVGFQHFLSSSLFFGQPSFQGMVRPGNTKGGSIIVQFTSCLIYLD
jgi:hypothetical protein